LTFLGLFIILNCSQRCFFNTSFDLLTDFKSEELFKEEKEFDFWVLMLDSVLDNIRCSKKKSIIFA